MTKRNAAHFSRRQLERILRVLELGFHGTRPLLRKKYEQMVKVKSGLAWKGSSHSTSTPAPLNLNAPEFLWSPAHTHQ